MFVGGPSGGLRQADWILGGFLACADPGEQLGQVCGGEVPDERPGGLVVPVYEGEQGVLEPGQAPLRDLRPSGRVLRLRAG